MTFRGVRRYGWNADERVRLMLITPTISVCWCRQQRCHLWNTALPPLSAFWSLLLASLERSFQGISTYFELLFLLWLSNGSSWHHTMFTAVLLYCCKVCLYAVLVNTHRHFAFKTQNKNVEQLARRHLTNQIKTCHSSWDADFTHFRLAAL